MAVTEEGQMWTFGEGEDGRLGHGDVENQLVPKLAEGLASVRVCQVSAGGCHSMAVTEGGQMWTFGLGQEGELGHADQDIHGYGQSHFVPKLVEGSLTCALGPHPCMR